MAAYRACGRLVDKCHSVGLTAAAVLGVPEDLRFIMRLTPASGAANDPFKDRWRYLVATSLLNPDGEDEWSLSRKCALNEFDDRWLSFGAIQTLKLIASPRSTEIL